MVGRMLLKNLTHRMRGEGGDENYCLNHERYLGGNTLKVVTMHVYDTI
jgi:hypothetical protein